MVLLCCYLNHKILNYHSLKDITFSNKLIFLQFHYSNQTFASNVTQKDFHTGIPLQAPKRGSIPLLTKIPSMFLPFKPK